VNDGLIYDWNQKGSRPRPSRVLLNDETLRDGLQSPSVRCPSIDEKLRILHLIDRLGIDTADIGLPGAGPHVVRDVERLAREIAGARLRVAANCAARTLIADIRPIAEISQRVGIPIEVGAFIGSSPLRQYAEGWTLDQLLRLTEEAIAFAVGEGLPVMYVTEDTTRADPDTLRALYSTAIRAGARRVCIADTVGHATPHGAAAVVRFIASVIEECGGGVGIDWHGHRDRDFAVINTLAALDAGATRLHGAAIGIGERVGNTPMELVLLNLKLLGQLEHQDLTHLIAYCNTAAEALHWQVPINYPLVGRDAFRTATGVHAAAIIKAQQKGDAWLADRIYSGVPAGMFGRKQEICVGYMSGASNVNYWLRQRKIEPSKELCDAILARAKGSDQILTDGEIQAVVDQVRSTR
jgi:2-isopropylmalate synthase